MEFFFLQLISRERWGAFAEHAGFSLLRTPMKKFTCHLILDSWLMLRMVIISQTIFVLRFTLDFKLFLLIVIISILSINSSHKSLLSSLWKLSKFLNKLFWIATHSLNYWRSRKYKSVLLTVDDISLTTDFVVWPPSRASSHLHIDIELLAEKKPKDRSLIVINEKYWTD